MVQPLTLMTSGLYNEPFLKMGSYLLPIKPESKQSLSCLLIYVTLMVLPQAALPGPLN